MHRLALAALSVIVALTLSAPDAEARGGRRGGGGKSHHSSAAKTKNTTSKGKTAKAAPVHLHLHVPASKAAAAEKKGTSPIRSTVPAPMRTNAETKSEPCLLPATDPKRPAACGQPAAFRTDDPISELCLLPASDPKRPAACAQLGDWRNGVGR